MAVLAITASQSAAAAAWVSAGVLVLSLVFAWRQVSEARRLREEQARPWVVVRFDPGFIFAIVIENIGRTSAKDVTVEFDPPLESTWDRPWGWEESSLMQNGIPMLPPRDTLRFHFDTYTERLKSQLPMQYSVTVKYSDPFGRPLPDDTYVVDLRLYLGMPIPPKALPDLVDEIGKIRRELTKWTDGVGGLEVHSVDKVSWDRRQHRPWRINQALRVLEREGVPAFAKRLVDNWRHRLGLYRQGPR